jgi:uncharacterized protein YjbI with pentapeptide repeats
VPRAPPRCRPAKPWFLDRARVWCRKELSGFRREFRFLGASALGPEPPARSNGVSRRTSAGPRQRAPAPKVPTPALPPIAAKADDLEAIKKAVDDAALVGGGLWLSYLFVLFYLAVAAGAVTHAGLFLENAVKLPFLNIELPLLAFFFLAPILFLIVHAYTLVHLVMLTDKAKRYDTVMRNQIGDEDGLAPGELERRGAIRDGLRWQLPSNIFIQFLAGPADVRDSWFGWLLSAIAWTTLVIAPVLLLLLLQLQFLPYHDGFITWTHRIALLADLWLLWWLWRRKILSWRKIEASDPIGSLSALEIGLILIFLAIVFSCVVATFPGEPQEDLLAKWDRPKWAVTPHNWLFSGPVDETTRRRTSLFSSTLVLPGFNIYEGLGVDDPDKAKWREFVFRARGRDLRGAILDFADLSKVDFTKAELEGASLAQARLQKAAFEGAQLQGASLYGAELQGATLTFAHLEGASLWGAQLQGATLSDTYLRGARLDGAHLQGAPLDGAQLQGASLDRAQLQGATLFGADLRGASLNGAWLQGASLQSAQLQGALLEGARLQANDFSDALLWRTNLATPSPGYIPQPEAIRVSDATEMWQPVWKANGSQIQRWSDEAYQRLRKTIMESLPAGDLRDAALKRIGRLDCANSLPELALCDASLPPPEAAASWRTLLEQAKVDDAVYAKALAAALRAVVCGRDGGLSYFTRGTPSYPSVENALYVLRGVMLVGPFGYARLGETGREAPELIDFISSRDCPVSPLLTDDDKGKLLSIKQEAIKRAGG